MFNLFRQCEAPHVVQHKNSFPKPTLLAGHTQTHQWSTANNTWVLCPHWYEINKVRSLRSGLLKTFCLTTRPCHRPKETPLCHSSYFGHWPELTDISHLFGHTSASSWIGWLKLSVIWGHAGISNHTTMTLNLLWLWSKHCKSDSLRLWRQHLTKGQPLYHDWTVLNSQLCLLLFYFKHPILNILSQ